MAATQQQLTEIVKCGKDPVYFCNRYARIQHPIKGSIPFATFPFQDDVVQDFIKHRFNIILKSRQLGLSTITAAYCLWLALFYEDQQILVIATRLDTAMNFMKKVKYLLANLPKWLILPAISSNNKTTVDFDNGSMIKAVPRSEDAGRSEALSLLIVDEAAFVRDFATLWEGLFPTLTTGGRAIVLSTPNGASGLFYELYTKAEQNLNQFNPICLPWQVHPEHDDEWFKNTTANMSETKAKQEYECVAGDTRIITKCGFKYARDIEVGDMVLTHKGRFRPVLARSERPLRDNEEIYRLSTPCNRKTDIFITDNHPLMVSRLKVNKKTGRKPYEWLKKHPEVEKEYLSIREINDFKKEAPSRRAVMNYLFPVLCESEIIGGLEKIDLSQLYPCAKINEDDIHYSHQWGNTKRYIDVDYDLGRFVGLYLAEGCAHKSGMKGLKFGFHVDEWDTLAEFVTEYMQRFNVRVRKWKKSPEKCCCVETFNRFIVRLVWMFIKGDYAPEKSLRWDMLMKTNKDFIRGLLVGYHEGDGTHNPKNKINLFSASPELIYQVRTLMSMFGHYPRIGHIKNNKPCYLEYDCVDGKKMDELILETRSAIERPGRRTTLVWDEYFVGNISYSHEKKPDNKFLVYSFEVADDRTYVADSIIVHNCEFLASGDTYISTSDIAYIASMIQPPLEREGFDKNVWIWKRPQSNKKYIISADVSRGSNSASDFSAFHVIDIEESEVVAEYKGRIRPDRFGEMLFEYGTRYNNALVCPENNTFGFATLVKLEDMKYPNIYFEDNNTGVAWINGQFGPRDIGKAGFHTNSSTRPKIFAKLEEVIRNKQIMIHSKRFYTELTTFIVKGDRPQAAIRANDDLVMSLAIGCWLYDASEAYSLDTMKRTQAIMDAMGMTSNSFENLQNSGDEVFLSPMNTQDERYNPQRIKMEQEAVQRRIDENARPKRQERAPSRTVQDFQKQFGWLF